MCLALHAKGEIDTEEVLPPIRIRKRYSPARKEMVFELVRSYSKGKTLAKFWICMCGSKIHTDITICSGCGRHRHHHHQHHQQVSDELNKVEKAYDSLKKDLQAMEKDLKDVKKECADKKECNKDKGGGDACKCAKEKKDEEKKGGFCKCNEDKKDQGGCKCDERKRERKRQDCCPCPSPTPTPAPQLPLQQYHPLPQCIPMIPAPCFEPAPKPAPPPEPRPVCPPAEPPIVNVIVPDYRQGKRRNSRHRTRSASVSSSSTVSVKSFERVRNRVSRLGRRVWGLEIRDQDIEDELRLRRIEQEQALLQAERARERARLWDLESRWDQNRDRDRGEERAFWRRKEYVEVEGNPTRMPFPFSMPRKDDFRFRHPHRRFDDDMGFRR